MWVRYESFIPDSDVLLPATTPLSDGGLCEFCEMLRGPHAPATFFFGKESFRFPQFRVLFLFGATAPAASFLALKCR